MFEAPVVVDMQVSEHNALDVARSYAARPQLRTDFLFRRDPEETSQRM